MESTRSSLHGAVLCAAILLSASCLPERAEAFGPAAHRVIMEKVTEGLPLGSKVRQAMEQHKDIASTAASGPDIPYCQPWGAFGYAPWADRYHYDRVGTFARLQLEKALASNDARQIAWAAGWVTHLTGDMAGHGTYTNPEAGVYLQDPRGRDLHQEMEAPAEVAVWVDLGGHPADTYDKRSLPQGFCAPDAVPLSLLEDASSQLFGRSPGSDYRTWYRLFKMGLSTGVGYRFSKYKDAQYFLNVSDRRARLTRAAGAAVRDAIGLLQAAEGGSYADFRDDWNLDAGNDGRPFGTLTVSVRTGDGRGAGTDADIYFGMTFSDGITKEWLLDKVGYNDFERSDDNDYYLFLGEKDRDPSRIANIYVRMGPEHGLGVPWQVASVRVRVNGALVYDRGANVWLDHQGDMWQGGWPAP